MLTTYAVSFATSGGVEAARARLVDRASDWLASTYPVDERPAGVRVRVRERPDDPVWRAVVEEPSGRGGLVCATSVSIVAGRACTVDIRRDHLPTRPVVVPTTIERVPPASLRALVADALDLVDARDALRRIRPTAETVDTGDGGGALAAFVDAPGRRLPVVVEAPDPARAETFGLARAARALAGLAHVVVVTGPAALAGFNELRGERLLVPGSLVVLWPGGAVEVRRQREMAPATVPAAAAGVVRSVVEAAARVLPVPHLPAPPAAFAPRPAALAAAAAPSPSPAPAPDANLAGLEADLDAALERIEELEAALAGADRMIDEKQALLDQQHGLLDRLVAQNVELAIRLGQSPRGLSATSAADAIAKAADACPHLTFHPRAVSSAAELQVADPTRILVDLHRLDTVAADWQSGAVGTNLFALACRNVGLDFAPDISDTAKHRFAQDYAIEWRGQTVYARAHVRRGRGAQLYRIHLYLDLDTRQVVVAYVGRHLRDASTS